MGKTKTLVVTIIIFVIVALIALGLVLCKGKILGYSLVKIEEVEEEEETPTYVVAAEVEQEYISAKDEEETSITVTVDGVETTEGLTFESSDEEIATVDENGTVTAVAVGSATITVTYEDASDTVDVKCITPIKSITFTSTSSSVKVGNDLQLKLQTSPSDASIDTLIYSSSNDEIATVNKNGIVTGVAAGKVTITVYDTYTGIEKSVNLTIR